MKLFYITECRDLIFASNAKSKEELMREGQKYLKEQQKFNRIEYDFKIKEITKESEVPKDWTDSDVLIWGAEEEISALNFLNKNSGL